MFSDLVVIELASVLAGPDVGMFFAERGAKVIKIENKLSGGDVTRKWKLPSEDKDINVSAYFSCVNYNKEYLFLNLKDEEDQQKVHDLVKTADIVVTNYKYGDDKKFKVDYNTLKSINPSIIYAHISGYGDANPRTAYDVVLQAELGYMSMNGTKDSGPVKMPIALIDVLAAHHLKEGILAVMATRKDPKQGCKVEVSLYDAALSSLKNQATNWLMGNHIPSRIGSLHPNIAPYGEVFDTKDGKQVVLAIGSDKHFVKLLEIINRPDIAENPKYAKNQSRVVNREELYELLAPTFATFNIQELVDASIKDAVPLGAIRNLEEVFFDERAQSMVLEEEIEGYPTKRVKGSVFTVSY